MNLQIELDALNDFIGHVEDIDFDYCEEDAWHNSLLAKMERAINAVGVISQAAMADDRRFARLQSAKDREMSNTAKLEAIAKIKGSTTLNEQIQAVAAALSIPTADVLNLTWGQYLQKLYEVTQGAAK